ncbi:UNVERIFIED_CONTAM: hypothetical protein FKN15_009309 [Acipenser sinensis]
MTQLIKVLQLSACLEFSSCKNNVIVALREQNAHIQRKVASGDGTEAELLEVTETSQKVHGKRLSNGSIDSSDEASHVVELQELLEKQNYELAQMKERMSSLSSRVSEVELELETARKDLLKSEEMSNKYQRDNREVLCQKEDMEERITTLERRYLGAQRESTSVHDMNDKLENELANKEAFLCQMEEKNRQLQERLELAEQKLQQTMRKAETLPEVEAELAQRIAALTKAEERHGSIEERMRHLEGQLEEKNQELQRARQREKMNEEHNKRLSDTVDRLLTESNERLQLHLKERMAALEDKNVLIQDSENFRKQLEDSLHDKDHLAGEIEKLRSELEQFKMRTGSLSEPTFSRTHLDTSGELRYSMGSLADSQSDHYRSAKVIRRPRRGRMGVRIDDHKAKSLGDHEWGQPQQISVLGSHPFESDTEMSDIDDDDRETIFSSMDRLSPGGHSDAQTLAMMLQEQLDAINREIRLIQEEKESTELQAEEIESRVASVSLEGLNLARVHPETSITGSVTASSLASSSPPSGHSTPKLTPRSPAREKDRMGVMTLPSDLRKHRRKIAAVDEDGREDKATIKCETSPPATPRQVRMTHTLPSSHHNDAKGVSATLEAEATALSSVTSSQDSLHKAPKKKGIKSSLGRKKKKKEKGRLAHLHKDYGGPGQDSELGGQDAVGLGKLGTQAEKDRRLKKKHELLEEARRKGLPFAQWDGPTVVAWLELWLGMPAWYVAACRANVKSGAIMSALSDTEIQREIGISNPLHRLKLRLAIQEMVSLTSPSAPPTSRTSIGLRDYANILLESGVHGSLVALDDNFDYSSLALLLQIPNQNTQARQLLEREYNNLLALGTERRLDENDDKNFRGGPSWRRQFHPRDVHGISMMPGSSETLPAGFRLTTTSGQSRNMSSEVLFEMLDDSPEDMIMDWSQGQEYLNSAGLSLSYLNISVPNLWSYTGFYIWLSFSSPPHSLYLSSSACRDCQLTVGANKLLSFVLGKFRVRS